MNKLHVVIGRFQPLHNSHLRLLRDAMEPADGLLVLVGSANRAPNSANPFSYQTRRNLIADNLNHPSFPDIQWDIRPLDDYLYNDAGWLGGVHSAVEASAKMLFGEEPYEVTIFGHEKDHSSYYLKSFPTYNFMETGSYGKLSATHVRDIIYDGSLIKTKSLVPANVYEFIEIESHGKFSEQSLEFQRLREEHFFLQNYKSEWEDLPHAPTFVTTDTVVYYKGHILLVKRKDHPGMGHWALPGGFIGANEWIKDGIIRHLLTETQIDVDRPTLLSNIRHIEVFANPSRSLRGRTITHCALIVLDGMDDTNVALPAILENSEGDLHAKWFSISGINTMSNNFFEDHLFIIKNMLKIN